MTKDIQIMPITTMPNLVEALGWSPEFNKFLTSISNAFSKQDWESWYKDSDMSLSPEDFISTVEKTYEPFLKEYLSLQENERGVSIEVNVDSIKDPYGKLMGKIDIFAYTLSTSPESESMSSDISKHLKRWDTSLYFTAYKVDRQAAFYIISDIRPFVISDIE